MTENEPGSGETNGREPYQELSVDANHARLAEALRRINEILLTHQASEELLSSLALQAEQLQERVVAAGLEPAPPAPAAPDMGRRDGNAVSGRLNVVAPPVHVWQAGAEMHGTCTFGVAHEGPPGCVHGGVIAAVFDDLLGAAQQFGSGRGMTGTLTVRYRRPTPLYRETHFRARHERTEGRKIFVAATLHVDGVLCADAEAVFVSVDFEALRRRVAGAGAPGSGRSGSPG